MLARCGEDDLKITADMVAGVIGLWFHNQFVRELISEAVIAGYRYNDARRYHFSNFNVISPVKLNNDGTKTIQKILRSLGKADQKVQTLAGRSLGWLLRAWSEFDPVIRFLALFIPIEIIVSGYKRPDASEFRDQVDKIRKLITTYGGTESKVLLEALNKMKEPNLSLVERFEMLANTAKMPGWKTDVTAFRRFNRVRNDLIHQGKQQVILDVLVGPEEVRELSDLATRYVKWVVQNQIREESQPNRSKDGSGDNLQIT